MSIYLGKRYEVLTKIGAGGMADVYKGKDHMLNRYVAIKVLKKEFREDETFVKKFRSEAQAAAGLLNPNIVNVYDVGEDRGLYYMVMELVDGITLKEYIDKKGRLSAKEVISIAIQMCNGIEAGYQAAQCDDLQGWQGEGDRFWYCQGCIVSNGQHFCDGIRTLYFAGAGKRRVCRYQE